MSRFPYKKSDNSYEKKAHSGQENTATKPRHIGKISCKTED
jgi:hypothetical protein